MNRGLSSMHEESLEPLRWKAIMLLRRLLHLPNDVKFQPAVQQRIKRMVSADEQSELPGFTDIQ